MAGVAQPQPPPRERVAEPPPACPCLSSAGVPGRLACRPCWGRGASGNCAPDWAAGGGDAPTDRGGGSRGTPTPARAARRPILSPRPVCHPLFQAQPDPRSEAQLTVCVARDDVPAFRGKRGFGSMCTPRTVCATSHPRAELGAAVPSTRPGRDVTGALGVRPSRRGALVQPGTLFMKTFHVNMQWICYCYFVDM